MIKVSRQAPLEDFSFSLKNESGYTFDGGNGFGEVAMQYLGGDPTGIDMSYSGNNQILQNRASEIANDDGSVYPVHFSDNDQDGQLSSGDTFLVYGPDTGPVQDGWKLDIMYDMTGNIIGSARFF